MHKAPTYPKRGQHSYWNNDEPFTDINEVLQLLNGESPLVNEDYHLHRCRGDGWKWEIVVPWYTRGDSGGDRTGYNYYQIDPTLAERLVHEGLVTPHQIPRMGYMETRDDDLVISPQGKTAVDEFEKTMRAKAESLLKPGVHTDLTGKPEYRGFSREQFRHGALYYEFELPDGLLCRVYPDEGKVLLPEEIED